MRVRDHKKKLKKEEERTLARLQVSFHACVCICARPPPPPHRSYL